MGIKEIPTNFRTYYKTMRDSIKPKYEDAVAKYENLLVELKVNHSDVSSIADRYKEEYKFDLSSYKEFVDNTYIDGEFLRVAKAAFMNKKDNYLAKSDLYRLYKFACQQKEIHDLKHQIDVWEKMLDLTLKEYQNILEAFYTEVHKELIIKGNGYVFENPMGWLCINRCKVVGNQNKLLDYKATKAKKAQLISEGKRLWNKEEEDYARMIGAEYNAEDYRVFKDNEYCYEFSLINCRVLPKERIRFKPTDSHRCLLGKSEDDVIAQCNNDLNKICNLRLTPRRKLYMCLKADNLLYLNFIRNEGQQSAHTPKANRKNRQ